MAWHALAPPLPGLPVHTRVSQQQHNSSSHLRPELAEARRAPSRIMGCENIRKSFVTVLALFMVGRFCFLPSCQASVTVTQL